MSLDYFDLEVRLDLVKNVNDGSSYIQLILPGVILKFLQQHSSYFGLFSYLNVKPHDVRYLYTEEVEELNRLIHDFLKYVHQSEVDDLVYEFLIQYRLSDQDMTKENIVEIGLHIQHFCQIALQGNKVLLLSGGYDDTGVFTE